jgi:tetratricopeptide (TPR) repeat protein
MPGSTRIDELRQKFHENPRRYFAPLANEYRKAGDPEQAIAICRAHLAQQPGHMSGHVVYGQALYDARRVEEARSVFEKALALDPDNAIVLRQLGDIAREKGESDEAKHWYTRALDIDPNDREIAAYIAELTEPVTEAATPEAATPEAATSEAAASAPEFAAEALPVVEPEPISEPEPVAQSEPVAETELEPDVAEPEEIPAPITPAIAPQEIEMVAESAPAPEAAEADREISIAPVPEPEIAPEPAPAEDDVAWRKTPPHEDSPFVTRTMAELYAKQGYREAALDVYRQLALHHPDDKEIFDRIEALEKDSSAEVPPAPVEKPVAKLDEIPFEPMISDLPSEPEPEVVKDYSDKAVYGAESDEDDSWVPPSGENAPHFTEMEIGGDSWDTDAWGAGFTGHDDIEVEFESPDVPEPEAAKPEPEAAKPETEREAPPEAELEPESVVAAALPEPEPEPEPEAEQQPEIVPQVAQLDPEPVDAEPEPIETESSLAPEPLVEDEPARQEPVEEEPAFVAYSPQPPADEDLPHFEPKGPTVREFFATLGAFRPAAREGSSITAHAAVPQPPVEEVSDLPLATEAFASLFGDSNVSDEDSRAAFALSGALAASQPVPAATPTPVQPAPSVETPAAAQTSQESEEDIRRFREWLDGLQES